MRAGLSRAGVRLAALAIVLAAAGAAPAAAQSDFPNIPVWSYPGAWRPGAGADTVVLKPRTITVRFLRDPVAEARPDFAGYRIYRATSVGDTTGMMLMRRYSKQFGDSLFMWHLPPINASTPESQRIATFIDPDSAGRFERQLRPRTEPCIPQCYDSIMVLLSPPGPHDGFRSWYSITYEARNTTDNDYLDLFLPDPGDCVNPLDPATCRNRNHKAANIANDVWEPRTASAWPDSQFFARGVEATSGPRANLSRVGVVPNPYRAVEAWNQAGENEIHFINLPPRARIRIYTVSGDLVREIEHDESVRDFARWDVRNAAGRDVGSGIYLYRVEADAFFHQSRFIVIR
jgi:hypothetical protein